MNESDLFDEMSKTLTMMQKYLDQFLSQHIQNIDAQLQKRMSDRDRGMWLTFTGIFKFLRLAVCHSFDMDRQIAGKVEMMVHTFNTYGSWFEYIASGNVEQAPTLEIEPKSLEKLKTEMENIRREYAALIEKLLEEFTKIDELIEKLLDVVCAGEIETYTEREQIWL